MMHLLMGVPLLYCREMARAIKRKTTTGRYGVLAIPRGHPPLRAGVALVRQLEQPYS
jgi:hypothetical protein